MARQSNKGRGRSRNRAQRGGSGRNDLDDNPSGMSTGLIALGAAVAAAAVTTVIMVNRRNMALQVCAALPGIIGGDTTEPTQPMFMRRTNPARRRMAPVRTVAYAQSRYYGGA